MTRKAFRCALPVLAALSLSPVTAFAQAQAALVVGATVAPHCRFTTEDAGGQPAVTASCGAASLRSLRVTGGRGEALAPSMIRRLRAGGDAVFVVSRDAAPDGRTVVVTFDF